MVIVILVNCRKMDCFTLLVAPQTMSHLRYHLWFKKSYFKKSSFSVHKVMKLEMNIPDQVLTDKGYDGTASDIWSCGVILFVLMAGYLPFDEPNLMGLYRKVRSTIFCCSGVLDFSGDCSADCLLSQIQKADFSFPSWFSSSSKKLIRRILDPNPLNVSSES